MIKIKRKISLLNNPENIYTGLDFSDDKYIALQPKEKLIVEYNKKIKKINNISTSNAYSSIAKDCHKTLFYMAVLNNKTNLFRTTCDYKEIDSLKLKVPNEYSDYINSISLNNHFEKILIATNRKVYSIDKNGNFITSEISNNATNFLIGINTSIMPSNYCCYSGIKPICKKNNYFSCAGYFCNNKYVAYVKDNSAYLAVISDNGNIISNNYIDDDIIINSIVNVNGQLELLITKNKKYNYLYVTNEFCPCENLNNDCDDICQDNDCLKNKEYFEFCQTASDTYDYMEIIDRCQSCDTSNCSIIESIALIEAALSHILNAEGEKIQKAVLMADDTSELLKVNDSVNQVIRNITFLEYILYNKLELSKQCESSSDDEC